ncbi:hypothetical protein F4604DRAFT_1929885 [Suillus subluteus]|nr:hypothetical protein F4604DRAFT_1929885 [Suillus subluteus]
MSFIIALHIELLTILSTQDRYSVFLRIMRQWWNLTSLKRSGCGHDPAGVDATQQGQLAVLCPACLQLRKNVPEDLAHVSSNERWLYSLFLAIDTNFRLKHRLVSNDIKDPGLSPRWWYFVEEGQYKTYLRDHADVRQEKSMCVSHNAIKMADTKLSKGLVATGVGSVVCAQHDMRLASGVGDLQRGEKYMNMDYIVFSALSAFASTPIVNFSYDIACQWHKKLWQRVSTLPLQLQPNCVHTAFNFFVLKFYIAAHIAACQMNFSFNWTPVRIWANFTPFHDAPTILAMRFEPDFRATHALAHTSAFGRVTVHSVALP